MNTIGVPRRTLRDIIDTVPATDPDTVEDSCSDISEDDEPKALPSPHTPKPLGHVKIDTNTLIAGPSSRAWRTPASDVKSKYQVPKSAQAVHYFMVQW